MWANASRDMCFSRAIFKFPLTGVLMKSARATRTWFLLSARWNNRRLNARSQPTWVSPPGLDASFCPCRLRILIENQAPARKRVPEVRNGRERNFNFVPKLDLLEKLELIFYISDSMRRKGVAGVAYFKSIDRDVLTIMGRSFASIQIFEESTFFCCRWVSCNIALLKYKRYK